MQKLKLLAAFLCLVSLVFILSGFALAQEQSGEYLKYQEPQPVASSGLSTLAYLLSLLFTFCLVIGLAYFTSRFLGYKFGGQTAIGDNKIITSLAFGPNRGIYLVDIAGRILLVGVTEHSVQLLLEITDEREIEKLRAEQPALPQASFQHIFHQQLTVLRGMSHKFPLSFGHIPQPHAGKNATKNEHREEVK